MDSLGRNITLPIYNADGTSFHGLELKKFTFDSVVMALGDKITGELYYTTNTLTVAQTEYVVYDGVKYYLINPPTIVKEGMKADNGTAKGMTKYSFTFYHPMFMLYNFPFTDVAVTSSEEKYKSQDKNFFWIGNLVDYVAKLNKNLTGTEWVVEIGSNVPVQDKNKLSEVLSFNDQKIADALKTGYDTWEIPYIIDIIASTDSRYAQGKRFLIRYGLPSQEILVENAQHQLVPYVFQMGQGVGLKNDSRTPKNNKIVTRIAGYGSEDNVPFGYPQILWTGNQTWNYTINNSASAPNSYPIYDGIVAGQRVRLIHHPFTRSHLMPTIYADTVNKKVNPYASGYDPTIEIKDYYDAVNDSSWTYPNQIIPYAPSYEIHEFSDIKPELGEKHIVSAAAFDGDAEKKYLTLSEGLDQLMKLSSETNIDVERGVIRLIHDKVESGTSGSGHQEDIRYVFKWSVDVTTDFIYVKFASSNINFEMEIHRTNSFPSAPWDDAMDDDGNYKQSYFNITLPQLDFDLYACAAVTQEMTINMRSGACLGCSFPVEVDWEDYKANFYDSDGNFAPTGSQRDYNKYPDSSAGAITIICKKEIDTFGTLMPNIYQQPKANDKFVILGISLPTSYITNAQLRLDHDMCQYMLDNNVHYFEWPLKFDEFFLANHTNILAQMKPNILVRFNFASEQHELYIKQISVKYGEKPLPQYNITLTDDIEIVLSPIGRVTDEVSSLRVLFGGGGSGSGDINLDLLSEYFLSKQNDDTAAGMIRFLRGLQVGENFVTGLLGEGGIFRVDDDGTTYIEADKLYIRMRAYFDTVEVKKYLHSGGNRIASKAGINCSRVEWIDANGEVTNVLEDAVKFRCYFRANGENGREITNDFVVNDLAFCKETNVDNTSIQQHGYWRCVVGVSSSPNEAGEHWIDLSKSDCQSGSNIPLAQDDIIQLGHKTDNTRQGAIVEFVGGEDAPSYQIYQGINSYDLTGKNYVRFGYDSQNHSAQAYIGNPDGSTYLWYHYVTEGGQTFPRLEIKANVQFTSPESSYGTQDLNAFISAVTGDINNMHNQIDGQIESWFYDYMPVEEDEGAPANTTPLVTRTVSGQKVPVYPYYDWFIADGGDPTTTPVTQPTSTTERLKHLGDTFYDNTSGYAFRFSNTGTAQSPTFAWMVIQDSAVIKALADAAKAQDTADHKRRAFVLPITIGSTTYNYPYPPYDVGDLWLNAKYPYNYDGATDAENDKYNNDVLRCVTSQGENGSFNINHWVLASKYTDDSALNDFVNNTYAEDLLTIGKQIDKKAETWYQDEDPSDSHSTPHWTDDNANHVGDIWCDTSANGGKKTYIWRDRGVGQTNRFYWAEQAVPDVVFDEVDKKAAIYVTWEGWITGSTNNLNEKDLFIPAADTTQGGVTYKKDKVYRCIDASIPSFEEIHYTDDSTFNTWLTEYAQTIIGINNAISDAQSDADAAATLAAAATYLTDAMLDNTGGAQATDIQGGLVLTSLIALRDSNRRVMSGISGTYQAQETDTGYKGHGIAAWYGGGMVDKEMLSASAIAAGWSQYRWARTLFRFDGSGYVADGNISWDKDGGLTIKGNSITATTELKVAGSDVLTQTTADARYVTIDWFRSLFRAYNSSNTELTPNNSTTGLDSIKAMVGFWTESYISALGQNSGGGGGGGTDMATVWSALATYDGSHQIAGGYLSLALNSYATKTWVQQQISGIPTSVPLASTGTVGGIKVKAATAATPTLDAGSTADRYYGLQIDGNGVAFVNVPWTNTTYSQATTDSLGLMKVQNVLTSAVNLETATTQQGKNYGIQIDSQGRFFVCVPWSDTNTTYSAATTSALGLIKVHASVGSAVTLETAGTTDNRNYGVQLDSNSKAFVCVPWSNTTYSSATTDSLGLVKVSKAISSSVPTPSTGATADRYYGLQIDSDGVAFVNVPWSNTTYSVFGGASASADGTSGLVPAPAKASRSSYLRGDGTWATPINTTYSDFVGSGATAQHGLVPAPSTTAGTSKYLREDGTWVAPPNTTYNTMGGASASAAGTSGLVPTPAKGNQGLFLRGDATWATPTNTTYNTMGGASASAAGTSGLVPTPAKGNQGLFLRGDATWATPTNTTYTFTDNNPTLAWGTKSKVATVGGVAIHVTMPANPNTDTDTKNTAGSTAKNATWLYLIGATTQGANPQTYTNSNCYVGTDNCLYSNGSKVLTSASGLVTTDTTQTISGEKTFNNGCWVIEANESNAISSKHWANGTYYNNANTQVLHGAASIRNALRFRWYASYWNIGNLRGGSTDSQGFAVGYEDTTNNRLIDCLRVTTGGLYICGELAATQSWVTNQGYVTTNTKNTAGSSNHTGQTMYLIGALSQASNAVTYSNSGCYIGSDGLLYSGTYKVVYNSTDFNVTGGRVGIGTDSPNTNFKADIIGNIQIGSGSKRTRIGSANVSMVNDDGVSYNIMAMSRDSSGHDNCSFGYGLRTISGSGTYMYGNKLIFNSNGTIRMRIESDGKVGIGVQNTSGYLLQVNGACAGTSWTNLSDMRQKNYVDDENIEFWQVFNAPMFKFTWKNPQFGADLHVGSSAQYWQSIVPEAVTKDGNGNLGLQYDVVALLAAITTAKKVQDHETRIQALERENAYLKNELKRLTT